MKKIMYFLLLLTINSAFPQNTSALFNKYIPKNVFLDKGNGGSVADNIAVYAKLNPDLIYYYLVYVDKSMIQKNTDPQSNYMNFLREKVNEASIKKNNWLISQINKNLYKPDVQIIKSRITDVDESLLEISKLKVSGAVSSPSVDTNKMYYYNYIYYKQDNSEEYNEKVNYYELAQKYAAIKKDMIVEKISKIKYLNELEYKAALNEIFGYWYLIGKDTENNYGISTGGESFKLLIESLPNKYSLRPQLYASVSYSPFRPVNITNDLNKFSDQLNVEHSYLYEFTTPIGIKAKSAIILGLGINYPVMSEMKDFCYIKIRINYLLIKNEISQPKANSEIRYESSFYTPLPKRYISTYDIKEVQNLKNNVLTMELMTPYYLAKSNLFLEIGVLLKYSMLSYDYSMNRSVSIWDYSRDILMSKDNILISQKHNNVSVNPVININWSPFKFVSIFMRNVLFQKVAVSPSFGLEGNYGI
ncbi:MAG: hypothetical protein Q8903_07460 [Bacteroidota bacterium]|nr:hypothetical protein [Bacteroidota bacterium]